MSFFVLFDSCRKTVKPASYEIIDPVRHYYPIKQGSDLECTYEIRNPGKDPLFINEIQTSCGCILIKTKLPLMVFPHRKSFINLTYDSTKNIGEVKQTIYCYGNFKDTTMVTLQFTVNVVPKDITSGDYEELFIEKHPEKSTVESTQDGNINEKNYYIENEDKTRHDVHDK